LIIRFLLLLPNPILTKPKKNANASKPFQPL
jgi:hypothetical protein